MTEPLNPEWQHVPVPGNFCAVCPEDIADWPCNAERMRLRAEELERALCDLVGHRDEPCWRLPLEDPPTVRAVMAVVRAAREHVAGLPKPAKFHDDLRAALDALDALP